MKKTRLILTAVLLLLAVTCGAILPLHVSADTGSSPNTVGYSPGRVQKKDLSAVLPICRYEEAPTGTTEFKICTPNDYLIFVSLVNAGDTFRNKTVYLANDLNMNGVKVKPIGTNENGYFDVSVTDGGGQLEGNYFAGTFDGQGYVIDYLSISSNKGISGQYAVLIGMFGHVRSATLKNIVLGEHSSFSYTGMEDVKAYVGSIAAYIGRIGLSMSSEADEAKAARTYVQNCYSAATVTATRATGGIVGYVVSNTGHMAHRIEYCTNAGTVTSKEWAGGILGYSTRRVDILNCRNLGRIVCNQAAVPNSRNRGAGGICAAPRTAEDGQVSLIRNCINNGTIEGPGILGGIVARLVSGDIYIESCTNYGSLVVKTASNLYGPFYGYTTFAEQALHLKNNVDMAGRTDVTAVAARLTFSNIGYPNYELLDGAHESGLLEPPGEVSGTFGNISWVFETAKGALTISGSGAIPSLSGNQADAWAAYAGMIKTVTVENGITGIGDYAFQNQKRLSSISIPESVESIGASAFSECASLKTLTIPDGITSIGAGAFKGCIGLERITIPNGVKVIEPETFSECISIKSVLLPEGLETVKSFAFSQCMSLESIVVPNSVTTLGASAFYQCTSLKKAEIGSLIKEIPTRAFYGCSSLTEIVLPSDLETIGSSAFYGCAKLKSIHVPSGVTKIGINAFGECEKLESIVYCGTAEGWDRIDKGSNKFSAKIQYHIYGQWQASGDAVHTSACALCGVLGSEAHVYAWTSESQDTHRGVCLVCEHECSEAHEWDAGRITQAPTHLSTGLRNSECKKCNKTREFTVEKTPEHSFGEATQYDKTQHQRVCPCGEIEYEDHFYASEEDIYCSACGALKPRGCGASVAGGLPLLLLCSVAAVLLFRRKETLR